MEGDLVTRGQGQRIVAEQVEPEGLHHRVAVREPEGDGAVVAGGHIVHGLHDGASDIQVHVVVHVVAELEGRIRNGLHAGVEGSDVANDGDARLLNRVGRGRAIGPGAKLAGTHTTAEGSGGAGRGARGTAGGQVGACGRTRLGAGVGARRGLGSVGVFTATEATRAQGDQPRHGKR